MLQEGRVDFARRYYQARDCEIAVAMQGYERLGVAHLMFQVTPYGPETLARLAEALAFYRSLPTVR